MKKRLALYFIACILLLSIDTHFNSIILNVAYYLFVLINVGYAVYLVTVYDNHKKQR